MTHRAVYAGVEGANTPAKEDIDAALVTKLLERVDTSQQEQTVEKMELSLGNRPATLCMVAFINEPNLCPDPTFVIAAMPPAASGSSEIWECQTLRLMLERIREQLALLNVQRQLLARERKEANVSLARNLGHDLTNIIATSKLDLLTLQRFAGRLTSQPITKAQQQAMDDTLKNLLNNARYMQEVVDIYRSFSYLNRPSYGEHDLNGLVKDIVSLFQLSTSLKLNVDLKLDPEIGMLELEPRLIKLALFNLLNNALDALQEYKNSVDTKTAKGSGVRHTLYQPEIRITSTPTSDGATLEIADNGPGIRDEKGQLMNSADVNRIFGLGYTTKAEGEGEGLGLSWVRTIILDFHGGNIQAENRDPQGAIFTLHFKSKADTKGTPSAMI
jgi:signal transduction histidine kinase